MISLPLFRQLVLIEQTLFGLPWVIGTVFLALTDPKLPYPSIGTWFWMIVAFSAARSAGMAFNRLIDQEIDAKNPRTADRPLPKGTITKGQVTVLAWGAVTLFLFACAMLNTLCLLMSPVAVFLFWAYSYTKRYTSCCHFVLGLVQLLGPVFAWAAITGEISMTALFVGFAVFASIAANDIIYAFQDEEFDRSHGLMSIPVTLGKTGAIYLVRGLHIFALVVLAEAGAYLKAGPIYFAGVAAIACVYLYYHLQLKTRGPDRFFFMCNTQAALAFLATSVGALIWQRLL